MNEKDAQYFDDFNVVMSTIEVTEMYGIPKHTVHRLCNEGKIVAMQLAGTRTWLISTRFMLDVYGYPPNGPDPDKM